MGQGDPLQLDVALAQLLFKPAVLDHSPGDPAKYRFATLGVGDNGDLHRGRSLFGQCDGTEQ
ncbi:hypothetical protein D3C80_2229220 [compost metagenome]